MAEKKTTDELIQSYLEEEYPNREGIEISIYRLNGDSIFIEFSYLPRYDWAIDHRDYDNEIKISLLDYLTWLYNNPKTN